MFDSTTGVSTLNLRSRVTPCFVPLFVSDLDDPLMNLLREWRIEQRKQAAKGTEVGRSFRVVVGEASIDRIRAQFAFQLAEAPAFQMLQHTAAQQPVGGDAGAPGAVGFRAPAGQALPYELHERRVVEERIDGVEQVVFQQRGLLSQGEIEEPGLVLGRRYDNILDYID
jgi:hypothetical protein